MSNFETVIFDLGGVLINWDPRNLYKKIFDDEAEMEFFLNNITTMAWNEEQDGGRLIADANEILIKAHPAHEENIRAYYSRWTEMLGGAIEDTVSILEELKSKGLPLYALTNWSAETWPLALERFEFLKLFDGILVSGQEKIKKPDPAIYKMMEDRFPLKLSTSLFIDDNLRNVVAARVCGLESLQFLDSKLLREELVLLDLL